MAKERYVASLGEYWKQSRDSEGYVFSKGPSAEIFKDPIFGHDKTKFQPGRILLPIDIWGWFSTGIDRIFNPKDYAPRPPQPRPPGNPFPAYVLNVQ